MVITYLGTECFKVTQGDLTLALNPVSKLSKEKQSKFGSDIVLVSLDHEDTNGIENASFGDRAPFVIQGPGEYEIRGVSVHGFASASRHGGEHLNTVYMLSLEGINLCFLGALGTDLPAAAKQGFDDVDILFVPVGGGGVLTHSEAYKLAVGLEPKVIIPMHYTDASLKAFLKEAGQEGVVVAERFTVKKKDLEGKEAEVVILSH